MNTNLKILLSSAIVFSSITVYAQDSALLINRATGSFFIAIVSGIILAFAFQFLLANLALALGITAIGDITEKSFTKSGNSSQSRNTSDSNKNSTPTGVKITSGAGLFMLITLSLSLFFASMIAVKLSLLTSNLIGFTLGMVIWAFTLLIGIYLDTKFIGAFTGSLLGAVKETISAGTSTVGNIFSKGEKSKIKSTAQETVRAIHEEIIQEYDMSEFTNKLDEYIDKLEPQRFDLDDLHEHIAELLHEIEIREEFTPKDPEATRRLFLEVAEKQPRISAKDKEKLKNAFDHAKEIMKSTGSRADKAIAMAEQLVPGNDNQGQMYREKVVQFLQSTNKEALNPDNLKNDLNKILNSPTAAPSVIQARASQIDRSTLKSALSATGIEETKAEQYLSKAEEVLTQIKSKTDKNSPQIKKKRTTIPKGSREQFEEQQNRIEHAIEEWFNRMGQPELSYDQLRRDMEKILHDPKLTPQILKSRLRRLDREALIALLSNNKKISREQAEKAVSKIEEARDSVIQKAEDIENKLSVRMEQLKEQALEQAEATRKTAASAAWWFFVAAVVSGGASALGGILAFTF